MVGETRWRLGYWEDFPEEVTQNSKWKDGWVGGDWAVRMRPDMEDNLVQRRQEPWAQL